MADNQQESQAAPQSSEVPTDKFGQTDFKSLADSILAEIGVADDNDGDETTEVQATSESQSSDASAEDSPAGDPPETEAGQEAAEGTEEGSGEEVAAADEKVEVSRLLESEKKVRELTEKLQALEKREPPANETLAQAVYDADDPFEVLASAGIDADLLFDRMIIARRGQDADPASVKDVEYRRTAGRQAREIQRLKEESRQREEKANIDKQVAEFQTGLEEKLAAADKYPALHAAVKADPEWTKAMAFITAAQFYNAGDPKTPEEIASFLEERFSGISKGAKPEPAATKKAPPARSPAVEARSTPPAKKAPKKLPRDKNEAYAELEKDVVASVLKDLGL